MQTIFKELTNFVKEADNVIIMTHKNSDLDALGSSICFAKIVSEFNIPNYVVLNQTTNNPSISKALALMGNCDLGINIVDLAKVKKKLKPKSLLVILDTSKKELVEYPELLDLIDDKIVIDHHVVGNKNIQANKLSYINANVSSTNEILINYLKFLKKNIDPLIATIMLAGIEVDTNSYNIKTSSATFYASAYLLEQGALNVLKKEILKEDKEQYLKREKYLEKSYIVDKKYAICKINSLVAKEDLSVLAERMLLFNGIEAAFAIGKIDDNMVAVSARSLGMVDVYKIMKKFDGGGHLTDAATQLTDKSVAEIEKELLAELEVM